MDTSDSLFQLNFIDTSTVSDRPRPASTRQYQLLEAGENFSWLLPLSLFWLHRGVAPDVLGCSCQGTGLSLSEALT